MNALCTALHAPSPHSTLPCKAKHARTHFRLFIVARSRPRLSLRHASRLTAGKESLRRRERTCFGLLAPPCAARATDEERVERARDRFSGSVGLLSHFWRAYSRLGTPPFLGSLRITDTCVTVFEQYETETPNCVRFPPERENARRTDNSYRQLNCQRGTKCVMRAHH